MLRHLLTLIWRRRRRHVLLTIELLITYFLIFSIATLSVRNLQLSTRPTGFSYENVWSVQISAPGGGIASLDTTELEVLRRGLLELNEVTGSTLSSIQPYAAAMYADFEDPETGRRVRSNLIMTTDDFLKVLSLNLSEGRSFTRADDGTFSIPAIINRRMAHTLFGDRPAIGRTFRAGVAENESGEEMVVVGLLEDFRHEGELMPQKNVVLARHLPQQSTPAVSYLLISLKDNTPRAFEAQLNDRLRLIRGGWDYQIEPLSDLRSKKLNGEIAPLLTLGLVGFLIILMVAFGLFGVLWQNVAQRIPEIGLRRALGASAHRIYAQIIYEQLLLSSIPVVIGTALLSRLPLSLTFGEAISWTTYMMSAAISATFIYLITLACALYPAWRASQLAPNEALLST